MRVLDDGILVCDCPHSAEYCPRCCVDFREMNADTRRGNRAAEAAAAGAETRDAPRSERPKYRTPSFEFDLARRNGQEPPPDAQRTFPVGTRLVMVANPVVQVEVLGFCPDGVEDELGEDAALDAYSVRFLDSGDTDLIPCYQVHDDLEFRRLSEEPTRATTAATNPTLVC